jgi:hypothetical protein
LLPAETSQDVLGFIAKIDNRCLHELNDYLQIDILSKFAVSSLKIGVSCSRLGIQGQRIKTRRKMFLPWKDGWRMEL